MEIDPPPPSHPHHQQQQQGQISGKDLKVETPTESEFAPESMDQSPPSAPPPVTPGGTPCGLTRQPSASKNTCLCSPTTHAGSFRCRLHRNPPTLQRTKSMDSPASVHDPPSN